MTASKLFSEYSDTEFDINQFHKDFEQEQIDRYGNNVSSNMDENSYLQASITTSRMNRAEKALNSEQTEVSREVLNTLVDNNHGIGSSISDYAYSTQKIMLNDDLNSDTKAEALGKEYGKLYQTLKKSANPDEYLKIAEMNKLDMYAQAKTDRAIEVAKEQNINITKQDLDLIGNDAVIDGQNMSNKYMGNGMFVRSASNIPSLEEGSATIPEQDVNSIAV